MLCYRAIYIKDGSFAGFKNFMLSQEFKVDENTKSEIISRCGGVIDNRYDEVITMISSFTPLEKGNEICLGVFFYRDGELKFTEPEQAWIDKCHDYYNKFEPVKPKPARKKRTTKGD